MIELGPLALGDLAQTTDTDTGGVGRGKPTPRTSASGRATPSPAAISTLIAETLQLVGRVRGVADPRHSRATLSGGWRGVLSELERSGPRTVPQIARARSVTRQYVQALVNALTREGLVEFADNPEHRRSRLVRLTRAGGAWLADTSEREASWLSRLELDASDEELSEATAILRAVGRALADEASRPSVRGGGTAGA